MGLGLFSNLGFQFVDMCFYQCMVFVLQVQILISGQVKGIVGVLWVGIVVGVGSKWFYQVFG